MIDATDTTSWRMSPVERVVEGPTGMSYANLTSPHRTDRFAVDGPFRRDEMMVCELTEATRPKRGVSEGSGVVQSHILMERLERSPDVSKQNLFMIHHIQVCRHIHHHVDE